MNNSPKLNSRIERKIYENNYENQVINTNIEEKEEKKLSEDKENSCFICSLNRVKFEIKGIDFEGHLSSEHNIANYFHYLMRINRTDEHDLNSIDLQVFKAFKERKINFFPIKKAKSLEEE